MISGSEVKLHVQQVLRTEEVGYEFHTQSESDVARDTMLVKDM